MRILLSCNHEYPSYKPNGSGKEITKFPSGSNHHQHDLLARGLAEKGHEVYYFVNHTADAISDPGVHLVSTLIDDVDIVHLNARINEEVYRYYKSKSVSVIATNHLYVANEIPPFKWVHVSKTTADLYQEKHYVWCGLDPEDYIYKEQKDDYYLFIANITRYLEKGLDIAFKITQKLNKKLVVAGSSKNPSDIAIVENLCNKFNVTYVGDVRGSEKAKLLANAKALFSPSKLPETFGITLIEALFSGTPVICSNNGAYGEIISKDVGFVCETESDYINAFKNIDAIKSSTCRSYAMNNFHYLKTTEKYLKIYNEILMSKKQINELNF
ncbi:MAG: glycosyl transferase family 1 [Kordia sp.]|nr:MAG: glycosyl transferase family 1 [Kordia sp.]